MYDHMVVQFENCVDCIQVLYLHFDTVWMLDHSCGHDRGREDGIIVSNMSTTWGGKQCKIRDTEIKQEMGYLGPTHLNYVWESSSTWFSRDRKHDEIRGNKVKHRLRKDLCQDIEWLGITTRGKTIKELQDIAVA